MSALPPKADMCSALAHVRFVPIADMGGPPIAITSYRNRLCDPLHIRNAARRSMCPSWTLRIVGITMNQNVPFIWRVNYCNKAASPETFLEIAHERARQYLRKNLSSMSVHKAV
jgi:hypothetical protein